MRIVPSLVVISLGALLLADVGSALAQPAPPRGDDRGPSSGPGGGGQPRGPEGGYGPAGRQAPPQEMGRAPQGQEMGQRPPVQDYEGRPPGGQGPGPAAGRRPPEPAPSGPEFGRRPPPPPGVRPAPSRQPAVVPKGWPIQRPPHEVIVRRPLERDRVSVRIYLPPLIFGGVVVDDPRYRGGRPYDDYYYRAYRYYDYPRPYVRDRLTWLDGQTLYREDGWTEFTLDCNALGGKLWFEVRDGRVRLDWAEVVFESGEVQVVDFSERSIGPGIYSLVQFRAERRVDHVRIVAEAASRQVRLILRMEL